MLLPHPIIDRSILISHMLGVIGCQHMRKLVAETTSCCTERLVTCGRIYIVWLGLMTIAGKTASAYLTGHVTDQVTGILIFKQ